MKVSDLIVRCLEKEGVKYIFGVPGEETEDLLFSLEGSRIQFVATRHEQGAAFMADVWGRVSGKAGVCLSTLGPGATNLVTGVADANLDKSPVVAISAQAGLERIHKESHQYLDIEGLFKPITKWNTTISDPDITAEVIRKAFKVAESEKPGAVHITLPEDIAGMETNAEPLPPVYVRRPDPDHQALREAAKILWASKHPIIIAGNGAVRKIASEQLNLLVKRHNIPVVHTFMGQGAVSDALPQSLFTIGLGFRDYIMEAIEQADVVVAVGYDIAEYGPEAWNPKKDKKIIHIDFTPAEVYTHYVPDVEIVADVAASLRDLNHFMEKDGCLFDGTWYRPVREKIARDIASYEFKEGDPFTVPGVLNILQGIMKGSDLLISDVGSHKMWIARNFSATCPNGVIISNGLASMGIAVPGALAASLQEPGRRVVAATGDGGFLMNSQELETARRMKAVFTTIIFNDNDYGLISWKQQMHRGHTIGTRLSNPDFKAYAESFGIRGYRPNNLSELRQQLNEAFNAKELCVMEIPVSTHVNLELLAKLKKMT